MHNRAALLDAERTPARGALLGDAEAVVVRPDRRVALSGSVAHGTGSNRPRP